MLTSPTGDSEPLAFARHAWVPAARTDWSLPCGPRAGQSSRPLGTLLLGTSGVVAVWPAAEAPGPAGSGASESPSIGGTTIATAPRTRVVRAAAATTVGVRHRRRSDPSGKAATPCAWPFAPLPPLLR